MKKIIFFSLFLNGIFFLNANELTGDTKLSCEAILCLSSSQRPNECNPSLNRYFSINAKKWKDTVSKRKNFLKLCPIESSDKEFINLRDNVLAYIEDPCDLNSLNARYETKTKKVFDSNSDKGYRLSLQARINPNLPNSCKLLGSLKYTNFKTPKYICSGEFKEFSQVDKNCWIF